MVHKKEGYEPFPFYISIIDNS
ncbi:hypothetical protein PT2222_180115 [Paraburkholderia tropica]